MDANRVCAVSGIHTSLSIRDTTRSCFDGKQYVRKVARADERRLQAATVVSKIGSSALSVRIRNFRCVAANQALNPGDPMGDACTVTANRHVSALQRTCARALPSWTARIPSKYLYDEVVGSHCLRRFASCRSTVDARRTRGCLEKLMAGEIVGRLPFADSGGGNSGGIGKKDAVDPGSAFAAGRKRYY